MTANELRYNILVGVDSLFEGTAPGYNDKQLSAVINRAQRRVFKNNAKVFDTNERIKRILSPLLKRGDVTNGDIITTTDVAIINYPHSTSSLASTFFTLPIGVGFITEEAVTLAASTVVTGPEVVLPVTYDYFTKNYRNRYKKPVVDPLGVIWRMDSSVESTQYVVELIYPNTHTIDNYIISYLRYPIDMLINVNTPGSQVSCEIQDQSFQDEIISESIKIIVASLTETDYNIAIAEKKLDEN
jgi:hypothetical protein